MVEDIVMNPMRESKNILKETKTNEEYSCTSIVWWIW